MRPGQSVDDGCRRQVACPLHIPYDKTNQPCQTESEHGVRDHLVTGVSTPIGTSKFKGPFVVRSFDRRRRSAFQV